MEKCLARVVYALLFAAVLALLVRAAAAAALAGDVIRDDGVFGVALVLWRCGAGGRTGRLGCYGLARDGRREVVAVVCGLGRLGLDFSFDIGFGGDLFGGRRSVVDGGVFADGAGCDGQELIEGQDARFAAAIALLAFVEDGNAGCRCRSAGVGCLVGEETNGGNCIALRDPRRSCRSRGAHTCQPWLLSGITSWYSLVMLLSGCLVAINGGETKLPAHVRGQSRKQRAVWAGSTFVASVYQEVCSWDGVAPFLPLHKDNIDNCLQPK